MGEKVRVVLPGRPRGKEAPVVTRTGTFIPKKSREEMEALRMIARLAMAGRPQFEGPVHLRIACYFPIPKSFTKKQREEIEAGRLFPTVPPDGSNIQKGVEDALQPARPPRRLAHIKPILPVIIKNDSQIVRWEGWKIYSTNPRVVVEIEEIG